MTEDFKKSDNIKNMPDINIFSFKNINKEEVFYTISNNNFNISSSFFYITYYIFNFCYGNETIYYSIFFNNKELVLTI